MLNIELVDDVRLIISHLVASFSVRYARGRPQSHFSSTIDRQQIFLDGAFSYVTVLHLRFGTIANRITVFAGIAKDYHGTP